MSLLQRPTDAPAVMHGTLPVSSRYTAGLAGERFFRALKDEGRILGSSCPDCEVTYVPARQFCERCLAELTDWRDVGLTGTVHSFTEMYVDRAGAPLSPPPVVAFVRIADGGLVHFLGDLDPDDVDIGLRVTAVLKPPAERVGSIQDIAYFRPA